MNYEEEIKNLNERVVKLEKAEKKRQIAKWIKLGIDLVGLIILVILFFKAYAFLKQYKEQLDKLKSLEDKITVSGDYLQSQIESIDSFFK
jgi:hypothetical protein